MDCGAAAESSVGWLQGLRWIAARPQGSQRVVAERFRDRKPTCLSAVQAHSPGIV